jgi:LysR substrate binding domain/Membrane dipeptidase (Peptidase family M19)
VGDIRGFADPPQRHPRDQRSLVLAYTPVRREPLMVLMSSDHPLTSYDVIHPQQLVDQPFIAMVNKAQVLRTVIDAYLERSGVQIAPTQGADNPAMSCPWWSMVPHITQILLDRGYKEEDVRQNVGGNWLRLMRLIWR